MSETKDTSLSPEFMKSWNAHPANRLSPAEKQALRDAQQESE